MGTRPWLSDGGKATYESMDAVAEMLPSTEVDELAEILIAMVGYVRSRRGGTPGAHRWSTDPDYVDQSRRAAIRWLKDHDYLD